MRTSSSGYRSATASQLTVGGRRTTTLSAFPPTPRSIPASRPWPSSGPLAWGTAVGKRAPGGYTCPHRLCMDRDYASNGLRPPAEFSSPVRTVRASSSSENLRRMLDLAFLLSCTSDGSLWISRADCYDRGVCDYCREACSCHEGHGNETADVVDSGGSVRMDCADCELSHRREHQTTVYGIVLICDGM